MILSQKKVELADYVHLYNNIRIHSYLDYLSSKMQIADSIIFVQKSITIPVSKSSHTV
jgi:transposase InsO family protein